MSDDDTNALLPVGASLPEGHTVEEVLATGRFGAAYVVRSADGERRAAHVLHAEHVDEMAEWFIKSAWQREAIEHPHMPRTVAVGTLDDGRPVEITELLEGESLRDALGNRSAPIPLAVVARIVREVASALDHLHGRATPIVHRAVTPENILLTAPDGLVKLLGVGEADRPRFDGVRPGYQSPEALADISTLTGRADIFVLGSVAYEALTGVIAFSGSADEVLGTLHAGERPSVITRCPDLPAAVDDVLRHCWELSPDKRPTCAMEAALALSTALGVDDTGETRPPETDAEGAPLQVVRRRNALLGPTLEMPAPRSSRSFLDTVEQTEVSDAPSATAKPTAPRAVPPVRATGPRTLREESPKKLALARPAAPDPHDAPSPRVGTLEGVAPPPEVPAAVPSDERAHDDAREEPGGSTLAGLAPAATAAQEVVAAKPERASPFVDDTRVTLQTQASSLGLDASEPTPRLETPPVARPLTSQSGAQPIVPPRSPLPAAPRDEPALPEALTPPPRTTDMPLTLPLQTPLPSALPTPALVQPAPRAPVPLVQGKTPAEPTPSPTPPQPAASPAALPAPRVASSRHVAPKPRREAPRDPHEAAFPDEPTQSMAVTVDRPPSVWRSPLVVASLFLANAIVIVGVAHAIALVANREPLVRIVQGPAPTCAPCAVCPMCPPTSSPTPAPTAAAGPTARAPTAPRPAPSPRRAPSRGPLPF